MKLNSILYSSLRRRRRQRREVKRRSGRLEPSRCRVRIPDTDRTSGFLRIVDHDRDVVGALRCAFITTVRCAFGGCSPFCAATRDG
jgi:hypothetical protein